VRGEPITEASVGSPPDDFANAPRLSPDDSAHPEARADRGGSEDVADAARAADDGDDVNEREGDDVSEAGPGLSLATSRVETDDDVHFGVAARALGVSRKTVERMVKRGQLERGPSNAAATVSKRALVAALEARRRDVGHLARATEIEQAQSADEDSAGSPQATTAALTGLAPVLVPLLDEFVAARTRAAMLENELEVLRAQAEQDRTRDELLLALATSGWWGRRKTRRAVLRQWMLGEKPESGSAVG
jgi:hypothetical protein